MASNGYITNCVNFEDESYGFTWLITETGMQFKGDLDELLKGIIEEQNNFIN